MGVLAPLYLAGLAALSLPLILHLVRRTPRGRQDFSSLMFLTPSPPRLTRRSRLDQILLLLMRLAVLALLAFAFARPFWRQSATLALEDLPMRRVAILLDTSASMRQTDLWNQAVKAAEKLLDNLGPHDQVALYTFHEQLQTQTPFDSGEGVANASQTEIVRQKLRTLSPTWQSTDLGAALTAVATELAAAGDAKQLAAELQIVLISDFQKGAKTEALQAFEWPEKVRVITESVQPKTATNAFPHLLVAEEEGSTAPLRVRVTNSENSSADQFFVSWSSPSAKANPAADAAVYVPPGASRVVRLERQAAERQADRIILRGDDHEFDNTYYVVPPSKQEIKLLYVGADAADDPQGMQYYLRLATSGDPVRQIDIQVVPGDATPQPEAAQKLVVVTGAFSTESASSLRGHAERGGTVLLVPKDAEATGSIVHLLDDVSVQEEQNKANQFQLLGEISFTHPLFVPFANPKYSDFTKIHFWKHRPLTLKAEATTKVIARFDNGDPAVLERLVTASGRTGRILLLASGWQPESSQFALSSKFVPFVSGLLDLAYGPGVSASNLTIGESLPIPPSLRGAPLVIHKPVSGDVQLPADAANFSQTDEPGIYDAAASTGAFRFAVNLAAAESNTAPLPLESLEQLGVRFTSQVSRAERLDRIRQQRDTELESHQKLWRWLLVGTLGLLIVETWWAGCAARQADRQVEVVA